MEAPDMREPTIDATSRVSARAYFNTQVLPSIQPTCGGCHRVEGGVGPGFLKPAPGTDDPYPTMVSWPDFIRLDDPAQSKFIRKGVHEGPALVGFDTGCNDQCGIVLEWLKLEQQERLALVAPTFKPAVRPFYPVLNGITQVRLDSIGDLFSGAYFQFRTTPLPGGRGVEISDLRFFNVKQNAQPTEQRTIRMQRILFVVWNNGLPLPDPGDNFATTDRTIRLFQDDDDPEGTTRNIPGTGNLIIPGLFTLTQFRAGSALSMVFDVLNVLPPLPGSNPCKPAGLNVFNNQVAPYLRANQSCTRMGCHDNTGVAGGINMLDGLKLPLDDKKNRELCEELKFYNTSRTLEINTNPTSMVSHPYRFNATNCTTAGFPPTCHTQFTAVLDAWRNAEAN
ncbi:MAG: hypothetical protein RMK29_09655 [Myxococcales bacterium]|nr:hypothetical protein [Myxococcota bacterium]MDW8281966.1 hypothetical protein [Myxococcales bacterium]